MSASEPLWHSAHMRALIAGRDIGAVVRLARQARGWRQSDLGAVTGYSASTISRLETGRKGPVDLDMLRRISRELGIPLSVLGELLGIAQPIPARLTRTGRQPVEEDDPVRRRSLLVTAGLTVPLGILTALDDALASLPVPATGVSARDVSFRLSHARRQFDLGELAQLVSDLPKLLAIAHLRAEQTREPMEYARLGSCYDLATEALSKMGYRPASRITADRSRTYARLSESPIAMAASARCLSIVLRHEGREEIADRITLDAAVSLEKTGLLTPAQAAAYAQMLCTCSYTAAQAGDRDRALEMIADAERAVIRLRPRSAPGQPISMTPAHVALYRVGVHWSLGDAGAALSVGRQLHPDQFPTPERRARLFTDLARSWWQWNKPEQTARALIIAHRYAPTEVRDRPSIRDIVTQLAQRYPNAAGVQTLFTALANRASR